MNISAPQRNRYMLKGALAKKGYDWWWHNFTGFHVETGEERAFFIEYYACNPALSHDQVILGQDPENMKQGRRPSYALIKAGTWGERKKQLHNFYAHKDFSCDSRRLHLKIGSNMLTETEMKGSCFVTEKEARKPENMCDAGQMTWDLQIEKKVAFHVGYGASGLFRKLNAFEMFWHAEGIKTESSGIVTLDGETYAVRPEDSYGYADKNWGSDFTSPWLWISSCNLVSRISGKRLNDSAVEFGGGKPKVFGIPLHRKLLGAFVYEGDVYEYNFSKFWKKSQIDFHFVEGREKNRWVLRAQNSRSILEMELECPTEHMLLINYESPDGFKRHNRLWNGGTGVGIIRLFARKGRRGKELIDEIAMRNTGCEYGEYSP